MPYRSVWSPNPLTIAFRPGIRAGVGAAVVALFCFALAVTAWNQTVIGSDQAFDLEVSHAAGRPAECHIRSARGTNVDRASWGVCGAPGVAFLVTPEGVYGLGLHPGGERPPDFIYGLVIDWAPSADKLQLANARLAAPGDTVTIPLNRYARMLAHGPRLFCALSGMMLLLMALERMTSRCNLVLDPREKRVSTTMLRMFHAHREMRTASVEGGRMITVEPRPLGYSRLVLHRQGQPEHTLVDMPESAGIIQPHLDTALHAYAEYVEAARP